MWPWRGLLHCPPLGQLGGGGCFQGTVVYAGVILQCWLWSLQWQVCLWSAGRELLLSKQLSSFQHLCALHGDGHRQPLLHGVLLLCGGGCFWGWWSIALSLWVLAAGKIPATFSGQLSLRQGFIYGTFSTNTSERNIRPEFKTMEQLAIWNSHLLKQDYGDRCSRGHLISFLLMTLTLLFPVLSRVQNDTAGFWGFLLICSECSPGGGCRRDWPTLAPLGLEGEEGCTRPVREQIKINPRELFFWQEWTECCKVPLQRYAAVIWLAQRCIEGSNSKVIQIIYNQYRS